MNSFHHKILVSFILLYAIELRLGSVIASNITGTHQQLPLPNPQPCLPSGSSLFALSSAAFLQEASSSSRDIRIYGIIMR